jgi:hypothetical protein
MPLTLILQRSSSVLTVFELQVEFDPLSLVPYQNLT